MLELKKGTKELESHLGVEKKREGKSLRVGNMKKEKTCFLNSSIQSIYRKKIFI